MYRSIVFTIITVASFVQFQQPATAADKGLDFPPATPESQKLDPAAVERLAETVEGFVKADEIIGAELMVIKNRKTVLHRTFGWSEREAKREISKNSIFCIRSMTKAVVGAAAQVLIDGGKLKLSDPIAKFISEFDTDALRAVTVEHLLTHTSGLQLSSLLAHGLEELKSIKQVARWSAEHGVDFAPGKQFQYSDDGADTLGAVIEAVSGMPLDAFVQGRILDSLGMVDSICLVKSADPRLERFNSAYAGSAGAWMRFWSPKDKPIFPIFLASQGMYSTSTDYARFLAMWMDGGRVRDKQVLSKEAVARALKPAQDMKTLGGGQEFPCGLRGLTPKYGQLMQVYVDGEGKMVAFGHGGSDGTHSYAFPGQDLMVLYFTQSRGNLTFIKFEEALSDLVFGAGPKASKTPGADAPPLEKYSGLYWLDMPQVNKYCAVLLHDGKLSLEFPWESVYALKREGTPDRWCFELSAPVKVVFTRESDQPASEFGLTIRGQETRWKRIQPESDRGAVEQLLAARRKNCRPDLIEKLSPLRVTGKLKQTTPREQTGDLTWLIAGHGRFRVDVAFSAATETTVCADGQAWSANSQRGTHQKLDGMLAEQAMLEDPMLVVEDWSKSFKEIVIVRHITEDDKPALVVRCVPDKAYPFTFTVSAETGQVISKEHVSVVPGAGPIGALTGYEDFREIADGLRIPFRRTVKYASPLIGALVMELEQAQPHAELDARAFVMPTDVK